MKPKREIPIKQVIRDGLKGAIYAPTGRRREAQLRELINTNTQRQCYQHYSFSYKGVYYSYELTPPRFKTNRLMPELHPSMDALLAEDRHLEFTEVPYVVGYFNRVLNASDSLADYYRLLPDSVHPILDRLQLSGGPPAKLTDEQVEVFMAAHRDWILLLKKRMFLDLITS